MIVDALIFAGGSGKRMQGADRPKQFLTVAGKPIICYTLEHFVLHPMIDSITISCIKDWIPYLQRMVEDFDWSEIISIVPGGETGQESIFNALDAIVAKRGTANDSYVLVHDGVRPLIDADLISRCIESVIANGATAAVAPCNETIVIRSNQEELAIADRSLCQTAKAPQAFPLQDLYQAHLKSRSDNLTFVDSVSLMSHYGHRISTVACSSDNIKITTIADYFAFKSYLDMEDFRHVWGNDE